MQTMRRAILSEYLKKILFPSIYSYIHRQATFCYLLIALKLFFFKTFSKFPPRRTAQVKTYLTFAYVTKTLWESQNW